MSERKKRREGRNRGQREREEKGEGKEDEGREVKREKETEEQTLQSAPTASHAVQFPPSSIVMGLYLPAYQINSIPK